MNFEWSLRNEKEGGGGGAVFVHTNASAAARRKCRVKRAHKFAAQVRGTSSAAVWIERGKWPANDRQIGRCFLRLKTSLALFTNSTASDNKPSAALWFMPRPERGTLSFSWPHEKDCAALCAALVYGTARARHFARHFGRERGTSSGHGLWHGQNAALQAAWFTGTQSHARSSAALRARARHFARHFERPRFMARSKRGTLVYGTPKTRHFARHFHSAAWTHTGARQIGRGKSIAARQKARQNRAARLTRARQFGSSAALVNPMPSYSKNPSRRTRLKHPTNASLSG